MYDPFFPEICNCLKVWEHRERQRVFKTIVEDDKKITKAFELIDEFKRPHWEQNLIKKLTKHWESKSTINSAYANVLMSERNLRYAEIVTN